LCSDTSFQAFDRSVRAAISHATVGLSPAALAKAFFDYWLQLALSPGKQFDLARRAMIGAAPPG
jgi:polyhydroxyalkanoate synthase